MLMVTPHEWLDKVQKPFLMLSLFSFAFSLTVQLRIERADLKGPQIRQEGLVERPN